MAKTTLGYEMWKKLVDACLEALSGLVSDELPDYDYRRAYESGKTSIQTARAALRAAKEF